MTNRRLPLRLLSALTAVAVVGTMSAGCFNPFSPRMGVQRGESIPAPVPSTAAGVLRLLEWCYNYRNSVFYRELLTEDYRFFFSVADSEGNQYTDQNPYSRDIDLEQATKLFDGPSDSQPRASSILLQLDRTFRVFPDSRPGKSGRQHRYIRTSVLLKVRFTDGDAFDVTGDAKFFLARGDVALIPQELKDRGFLPDSNRWYIERWEDETLQPAGSALMALRSATSARPVLDERLGRRELGRRGFELGLERGVWTSLPGRETATFGAHALSPLVGTSSVNAIPASWGSIKTYYRSP